MLGFDVYKIMMAILCSLEQTGLSGVESSLLFLAFLNERGSQMPHVCMCMCASISCSELHGLISTKDIRRATGQKLRPFYENSHI